MRYSMNMKMVKEFGSYLRDNESSNNTIAKYTHDMEVFMRYAEGRSIAEDGNAGPESNAAENSEDDNKKIIFSKETVLAYKRYLEENYKLSSANSMIAALNRFFKYQDWEELHLKVFKTQHATFRESDRELTVDEYKRLLAAAKSSGNMRLYYIIMTICCSGIRVSELPFITVSAVSSGCAYVTLKGKKRMVVLTKELCRQLQHYIQIQGIQSGPLFVTKNGKPVDRSNVLHEMKMLGKAAGVEQSKIFPHNLRHLFAVTHYGRHRDISRLADILGHVSINTTRIYTMVSFAEEEKGIGELGLVIKNEPWEKYKIPHKNCYEVK